MFFFDYFFYEKRSYRKVINMIGYPFRSLYCGNVRVDQYGFYTFFSKSFQGLRSGVIKFSGFPDFKAPEPNNKTFFIVLIMADKDYIISINRSNKNSVSVGPLAASGWNCTEKNGLFLC